VSHPVIGVQIGQLSAAPCWSQRSLEHKLHCEVASVVQVRELSHPVIGVQAGHVSAGPDWSM
jgi:hypothetical protein